MAVVTVKSAGITNRDAVPAVLNNAAVINANLKCSAGLVTITSGDNINSTYAVCTIPSNALVRALWLTAPDIGTTTAADIGLYDVTAAGGAVVSGQLFQAGAVLNAGPYQRVDYGSGKTITVANSEKRIWELLGLAADPVKNYDVVLKLTGTADATGAVLLEVVYTQ